MKPLVCVPRIVFLGTMFHEQGKPVKSPRLSGRAARQKVFDLLKAADIDRALEELYGLPYHQVINSLFSFLYNVNPQIKWNAVTALGMLTARLADQDMESARVIIRRLMWNLNDESGGIGWGSSEAMGEILANHQTLANEYHQILISYSRVDGNFQENETIQGGVLWGIGRLSQNSPDLMKKAVSHLIPNLDSPNNVFRGLTAWIMGLVAMKETDSRLEKLLQDDAELQIYIDRKMVTRKIKDFAKEALGRIKMLDT